MELVQATATWLAIHSDTATPNSWRCHANADIVAKTQGRCERRGILFCFRLAIE